MTLSTSKTHILTNSRNQGSWKVEEETIEEILVAKYMGVNNKLTRQINGGEVRIRYHQKSNKLCFHNNEPDQRINGQGIGG